MTQSSAVQAIQTALQHFRSGRLQQAETICRDTLAQVPEQPAALHLLALIARACGQREAGLGLLQRAMVGQPANPELLLHAGIFLRELSRFTQAVAFFEGAVALKPDYAEAYANLGDVLPQCGREAQAAAAYEKAVALNPDYAEAWNNFGMLLRHQKKFEEACEAFGWAVNLRPDLEQAHTNLGNALSMLDRWDEAAVEFEQAVKLKPNYATGWNNLGLALQKLDRPEPAMAAVQQAIALDPQLAEAHVNLGNMLRNPDRSSEALAAYDRAIAVKPDLADAYANRGALLLDLARCDEALRDYQQAIALQPDLASAHFNYAMALLLNGDYARGLAEYEWREPCGKNVAKAGRFTERRWDGGDLQGKTILLYCEQGFGDIIQCVRYAPLLAQRGAQVVLETRPALARLLQSVRGITRLYIEGEKLPPFDVQIPIMSLPGLFVTTPQNVPGQVPYLHPDAALTEHWRERVERDGGGFRVGLVWSGNPQSVENQSRSAPLSALAPLLQVPGVCFYSLQKGAAADQAKNLPGGPELIDWTRDMEDFADTAALMVHLDLIITVCTSAAHLAGALGKETWILLKHVPDWRWHLGRTDSPWYPTARLFRQPSRGDWSRVIDQVAIELASNVGHRGGHLEQ